MSWAHPQYLVETDWLAANLEDPALRVLECTTILHPMPDGGYKAESGRATWATGHIPRSGFADLTDDLCDRAASTLYMMPPTEQMAAPAASRTGVPVISPVAATYRLARWSIRRRTRISRPTCCASDLPRRGRSTPEGWSPTAVEGSPRAATRSCSPCSATTRCRYTTPRSRSGRGTRPCRWRPAEPAGGEGSGAQVRALHAGVGQERVARAG